MNMGSDLWNISTPHHIQQLDNSFISSMITSNLDYIKFVDFKINNMFIYQTTYSIFITFKYFQN